MSRLLFPTVIIATLFAFGLRSPSSYAEIYQYTAPDGTLQFSTTPNKDKKADKVIGQRKDQATDKTALTATANPNPNPNRDQNAFDAYIKEASNAYGVPFAFIKAVIRAESGFNPHAVSSAGAIGLMQLMPSTAQALNCDDPFDPQANITAGTRYLNILLNRYNGDLNLTLAAYNAGSGSVSRAGGIPFEATRRYIERVYDFYRQYLETPSSP